MMPKKKVKVYPRMNPDSSGRAASDFESRNSNVVRNSTSVEEVLQDNRGRLKTFLTTYEKPREGFFSQFAIYLDRGRERRFVVQGPEQGPFDSYEDAREAAIGLLSSSLMAAADQSDIRGLVNPARRDVGPDEFYKIGDIEHFNDSMTDLFEAALVELGESKPTKATIDAILNSMSEQVDAMLSRAVTPGFSEVASRYAEADNYGLVPEVSIETLSSLKGNLRTLKSMDFSKFSNKKRIEEFTKVFMG